jgi:hypothetical protein
MDVIRAGVIGLGIGRHHFVESIVSGTSVSPSVCLCVES